MDLELKGRTALVTAGTRGLGRACAQVLADEGVRVAITGSTVASAERAASEMAAPGRKLYPVGMDLTDTDSIDAAVEQVQVEWGAIELLVASSPGPKPAPVRELTREDWVNALDTNFLAMMQLTEKVLPDMIAEEFGRLLYIGTIGVRTVQPEMALSNATRLALLGYIKTLSVEHGPDNIIPNFIAPGPVATDRFEDLIQDTAEREGLDYDEAENRWLGEIPLRRAGQPDDLATMVALLCSPRCSYTTGAVIPVDGGKATSY